MNLTLDRLILIVPAFVIAIAIHEASHAAAATLLGDSLPRRQGRLSLNPLRHLDPLGTLTLFLMGFGWGKPVYVNPAEFRINPITGNALVSFAGPLSNLLLAALFGLPFRLHMVPGPEALRWTINLGMWAIHPVPALYTFFGVVASINLLLAVFNLIPLPPLDGFAVLMGVLPRPMALTIAPLARYGPGALLALFAVSYLLRLDVIGGIIYPPYEFLRPLVIGLT